MKILFTLMVSVILVLSGCSSESKPESPTHLIGTFQSGASLSFVAAELHDAGLTFTIEEEPSRQATTDPRPPLDLTVWRAHNYSFLDQTGELRLQFVAGKLASTWFYPVDAVAFETALQTSGVSVSVLQATRTHPATVIREGTDHRGLRYWAWEDPRAIERIKQWIRDNA